MTATPRPLTPFEGMDIRTLVDRQARDRGDRPWLIWEPHEGEGFTWTYAEFQRVLQRFAAGLQARGVAPGERVLVHLDNSPESVVAWLGCAYAGAVGVTTNARSSREEISYFAEHCGAVGAITQPRFAEDVLAATPNVRWRVATATDNGAPAQAPAGFEPFAALDGEPAALAERPHDPWAHFSIQYTSGTTARPKAVLWTHANALWGARQCAVNEELREEDVSMVHLPLFHTNAQSYSVLAALWAGAAVVLVPRFSASRFWPLSLKHGASFCSTIPFCVKALMSQPVPEHRYRHWGGPIIAPGYDKHFGITSIGWWGMTETISHGTVGSVHVSDLPGTIGRPAAGYSIHVLGEDGSPVTPGETGDLYVGGMRGVSLFLEYAGDPAATAKAFARDGLFDTGDRVRLGEDGGLYFADRAKDMLKVGGENVAASEIERVVMTVPGVREVAVAAMRHPMLDEAPVAFVIPEADAPADLPARIDAACATALASFKRPHQVRLVDALPRSTLEKVAKNQLRQLLLDEQAAAKATEPQPA